MDTLDVLDVGAKVGGVIDLVFEEDARDLVGDEGGRLDGAVAGVQEVGLQRAGRDGELEVASGLEVGVADRAAPHLERVGRHAVFRG